jgi:leucyl aminopeptidase
VITFRPQPKFDHEAAIVLLTSDMLKNNQLGSLPAALKKNIESIAKLKQFNAENGQIFPIVLDKAIFVLVGLGKKSDLTLTSLRIQLRKSYLSSYLSKAKNIEIVSHDSSEESVNAIIEGILIGSYSWKKYRAKPKNDETPEQKNVILAVAKKDSYERTITICEGMRLTRDLVNDNADVVNSDYIEKTVRGLVKGKTAVKVEILGRREMTQKGLGFHLAVNQGSRYEPKLIIVKYTGNPKSKDYTALIGKGITFDTGGLNLKPTNGIETMRTDMSGSAAVIGTLKNTLALKLKKNIIFAMAVAENAIDALAFKPGDVIRGYAGKTAEIGNTDAEGRLVLADAIAYLVKNYKPARIIDIATLTGACVVALGHDYSGLVSTDDDLSRQLINSSKETDDRIWRLPSYPELKDSVKSPIADIKNIGAPRGAAGALTAAEFLRQFTEGTKWAHLDIAGTAYIDGCGRWYYGQGATGVGVRLLTHFISHN